MKFNDIKAGYILHTLDKNTLEYYQNDVVDVSAPRVRNVQEMYSGTGMVVDVTIDISGDRKTFTLGVDDSRAIGGGYVISTNVDDIAAEIKNIKRSSEDALFAMEKHKETISKCDEILSNLPSYHGEVTDREVKALRGEIAELKSMIELIAKGGIQ